MNIKLKAFGVLMVGGLLLTGCSIGDGDAQKTRGEASTSTEATDPAGADNGTPIMNVDAGDGMVAFAGDGGSSIMLPQGVVPTDLFTEQPVEPGSSSIIADMPDGSRLAVDINALGMTQELVDSSNEFALETYQMMPMYSGFETRDLTWGDFENAKVISYVDDQGMMYWRVSVLEGEASASVEVIAPKDTFKESLAFRSASTFKFAS